MIFSSSKRVSMILGTTPTGTSTNGRDILFDGGILHIVDRVLTPPQPASTLLARTSGLASFRGAARRARVDVDRVIAGLTTNAGNDVMTILAPLDAAFTSVGSALLALSVSELAAVVRYHVIVGGGGVVGDGVPLFGGDLRRLADDARARTGDGVKITTLQGGTVTVRAEEGGRLFINSARVVQTDFLTTNGVVHILDG